MGILPAGMYTSTCIPGIYKGQKEIVRPHKTRVMDGCEPSFQYWEPNRDPL